MANDLYEQIPGLREAEEAYKNEQMEAFAGIEPSICGVVMVNPFTPQMYLELEGCGNAFINGKEPTPEDAGAFMWRISPKYKREDSETRLIFISIISTMAYIDVCKEIYEYRRRAWSGMPQFISESKSGGVGNWVSGLVHCIASNYHWTEQEILNMPFRRLWQYTNRIMEQNNPKYKERCAEAQRLRSDWLKKQNEPKEEPCLSAK